MRKLAALAALIFLVPQFAFASTCARFTAISGTEMLYNTSASSLSDASGNTFTLTNQNPAVYGGGYDGSANFAFSFNNSWFAYKTGALNLTASSNTTFEFYVDVTTAPTSGTEIDFVSLVTNDASNSRRASVVGYVNTSGTLQIVYRHGGTITDVTHTLTTGTWVGIGMVIDVTGNLVRGYVDGTEILNTTLAVANSGNSVGIQVGSGTTGSTIPTAVNLGTFLVDDLRITNTARTAAQITSDFVCASAAPLLPVSSVIWW
jgi:hypothetical protein